MKSLHLEDNIVGIGLPERMFHLNGDIRQCNRIAQLSNKEDTRWNFDPDFRSFFQNTDCSTMRSFHLEDNFVDIGLRERILHSDDENRLCNHIFQIGNSVGMEDSDPDPSFHSFY